MEIHLLNDIVLIFGLAIAVIYLCQKLKIPSMVGLLITGVLAGPHGLALVKDVATVDALAELGIILLLFTIGMEFSLQKLVQIRKSVFLGGALQVLVTTLATMFIVIKTGYSWEVGVFIGFLVSLSSTAIVLKLLQDRSEIDTPYGRNTLGILIFQDIVIIPMILLAPILAKTSGTAAGPVWVLLLKVVLVLGFLFVSSRWVAPYLLYKIARQQNRELFLISIITMGLAVAWLTSSIGLSISLGAFLAGLIISESEYSHQALGNILPFRDVFTSIFFVSVGMLFNMGTFLHNPAAFTGAALGVLIAKALLAGLVVLALGFPLRTAVLAGIALSQVGEFSFILSRVGLQYQLLSDSFYQMFIIVSVLTMAITPFSITFAPRVARVMLKLPLPARLKSGIKDTQETEVQQLNDHLVIIGFGVNGKNLALAASASGIPYLVIEMNPDIVRKERQNDEPIFFGDATHREVLDQVNLNGARVVVVAISDPAATIRVTDLIHKIYPSVHIIVRTRYIQEIHPLYTVGANEVIPEEFETSVEIFSLVLKKYMVPKVDIERFIAEIRADGYEMLRSLSKKSPSLQDIKLHYHDAEMITIRVDGSSPIAGKTLKEIDLRIKFGVTVLLIQRGSETIINPSGDERIEAEDQAVLLGTPELITGASWLFGDPDRED
ncbi:MAG: cation:proton antiporter [Syntrophomonas sp.]